ncbi:MAG: sugar phosphate isomerase/epimerase [Clostridia bacterium]|nr:sugar phosphate isomerase/epimerase [Clostridia bacterium]
MKIKFKLGVITDEVTQDIFEAAEFCKKHGLECMEVRSVNDHSPFDFTDQDIADINAAAKKYDLSVCAISAPLFKCDFDDDAAIAFHIENFEKCAMRANQIGAKMIRGFDFWDSGVSIEKRAEKYKNIAQICQKYDIICVIEADPSVHSNTPHKTAELVKVIDSPYIKVLFDPGNEVWVNEKASDDAYMAVNPYLAHIHIKDADIIDGKPDGVKIGAGLVDYKTLFARLIDDEYCGNVMLETHYRKNVELTEEQLKRPGGSTFSLGAYEASEESIVELKKIINSCKED